MENRDNVLIFDHPLIQHKVSLLRDKNTTSKEFRELVSEIAMLMGFEVTRDIPLKEVEIETPVALAHTKVIAGKKLAFVPILRAGLGMVLARPQLPSERRSLKPSAASKTGRMRLRFPVSFGWHTSLLSQRFP